MLRYQLFRWKGLQATVSHLRFLPTTDSTQTFSSRTPADGKTLADFITGTASLADARQTPQQVSPAEVFPTVQTIINAQAQRRLVYVQTMGCQMNVSDSEVVLSILHEAGYDQTSVLTEADVVLINTCAIREGAEKRIWSWLGNVRHTLYGGSSSVAQWRRKRPHERRPVVGVLGCMAERLKGKLLEDEKVIDLVAGPDAYRDLPRLISAVQGSDDVGRSTAMNVQLSLEETYADVVPVREAGATSAFLSIMRGCNNMCAFCIVPFTRGRERSRPAASIIEEIRMLSTSGVKEVTLLGQNVNSYADWSSTPGQPSKVPGAVSAGETEVYAEGFKSVYRPQRDGAVTFAQLLQQVADVDPEMRIRFTSPHPKEFSPAVLDVIRDNHNVCSQLHMPAQSGATSMLSRMKRGYSRDAYDALVTSVQGAIPGVALSTDIITGFCGETDEEHAATVDLMRTTKFDTAFMFAYSQRAKTAAARHQLDDVPEGVKNARLQEIIAVFREGLAISMAAEVGRRHLVLVQGPSKRDPDWLTGRTDSMKRVVFQNLPLPPAYTRAAAFDGAERSIGFSSDSPPSKHLSPRFMPAFYASGDMISREALQQSSGSRCEGHDYVSAQSGDYVAVEILSASAGTLRGRAIALTSLQQFVRIHGSCNPSLAPPKLDFPSSSLLSSVDNSVY